MVVKNRVMECGIADLAQDRIFKFLRKNIPYIATIRKPLNNCESPTKNKKK